MITNNINIGIIASSITKESGGGFAPTYDSISLDVSSTNAQLRNFVLTQDGTKMFTVDDSLDVIRKYTLSTAHDISTATDASLDWDTTGETSLPRSVGISSDGSRMWIGCPGITFNSTSHCKIFEYDCGTNYDPSSITYNSVLLSTSLAAFYSMSMAVDGSEVFCGRNGDGLIRRYILSTADDLSTAGSSSTVATVGSGVISIFVTADKLSLYFITTTDNKVHLWTRADTTSSFTDTTTTFTPSETSNASSLFINETSSKMYIGDNTGDVIYQYSM